MGNFTTSLPLDDIVGLVTLGMQFGTSENLSLFRQYDGEFSEHDTGNGGSIGGTVRF